MGNNIPISVEVGNSLDGNYRVEGYYRFGWWFCRGRPD
jgi:hypothetical protein